MATVRQQGRYLRTHADRPIADPKQDAFGFLPYADAFSLLINDATTATPLMVAISGPWGSGKTSLAQLIELRLKVEEYWRLGWEKSPITCWFNAWMHRDAQHLGAALAASVARDVSHQRPWYWRLFSPLPSVMLSAEGRTWRRVWIAVVAASLVVLVFAGILWIFPQLRPASGKLGHIYGNWKLLPLYTAIPAVVALFQKVYKVSDSVGTFIDAPRSAAAQGTLAEVRDQLGRIMRQGQRRWRGRAQRRIVIFVDDLERCPADKALDVCEVVSQLLGHENVVTVLVADLDLLESAAEARYRLAADSSGASEEYSDVGQEYLNKMIQLRFNLPPLDRSTIASALGLTSQPAVAVREAGHE